MRLLRPLLGLAVLAGVLCIAVPSAEAMTDTYQDPVAGAVSFHPFTIDVPTGGCPQWTDPDGTPTRNCDPVNLIFPGKTWQEVRAALLAKGWSGVGFGTSQTMHFGDAATYPQDAHVFRPDGPGRQYHVRLWQVRGVSSPVTLAAVHHERTANFTHVIDMAWEQAEAFLARQLCRGRRVRCASTELLTEQATMQAQNLDGDGDPGTWRGWANNTQVTVIRLGR